MSGNHVTAWVAVVSHNASISHFHANRDKRMSLGHQMFDSFDSHLQLRISSKKSDVMVAQAGPVLPNEHVAASQERRLRAILCARQSSV